MFILLCIILIVLINRNKRKREQYFLLPLYGLAEKENCKVSRYDIWNNSIIGIDETTNFIFAIKKINGSETAQIINLAQMLRCRVVEISRTSGPKEGNIKVFDRIDLAFTHVDKNKPESMVEFYNANADRLTLTGELQKAEKWCKIANDRITALAAIK